MQQAQIRKRRWLLAGAAAALGLLWWGRELVWLALRQVLLGTLTALAALPVMKQLEKRLPSGFAAALAIGVLNAALAAALFWIVPALVQQARQLAELLPGLWQHAERMMAGVQEWLAGRGVVVLNAKVQNALLERVQQLLGTAVPAIVSRLGGWAGGVGQWLLAPVFGFYFLRDRRMISGWLLLLLPVSWREAAVHVLREMRRETAGYLRGQLMISAIVAALSATGLLLCGVPAWLALGVMMGVLELIPYVGPVIGVLAAALFSLPLGWWRTLWALGVVIGVQQLEGSVLSPRLISQTTRLHPTVVVLCVMLGGAAAGVSGILLGVPLLLCLRAALRVILLHTADQK